MFVPSPTAETAVPALRWSLRGQEGLRVRAWPGESAAVAYCERSGNTHLLDPLSAELLSMLGSAPRTAEALLAELADSFDGATPAQVLGCIAAALRQLEALGLVQGQPA